MHFGLHLWSLSWKEMDLNFKHKEKIISHYLKKKFLSNSNCEYKILIRTGQKNAVGNPKSDYYFFSTQSKDQTLHLSTFLTSFLMYITRDLGHKVGKSSRLFWHQNGLSIFFAGNGILPIFSRSRYILK